jgi:CRP/FNR family transcriptional regulator, cyclic AMP receptor protein
MAFRLLAGVPDEDVRRLTSIARRRRFARGDIVFHRDDPGDSLHLIVKGRFAIRNMTPLGDTVTVAVRGPGDSFGEMALVDAGHRRNATVSALEASETLAVVQRDFEQLQRDHAAVTQVLLAFLADEVRRLNERLLEALFLPVERRVLRRLAELCEIYSEDGQQLPIPLTQEELASLAGATRPTVNQVLREEQRRGTLELRRGQTVVLDRAEIARRAR